MNAVGLCCRIWVLVVVTFLGPATNSCLADSPSRSRKKARTGGEKYAFLVAVGDYDQKELRPLEYTHNDIRSFHEALLGSGFPKDNIVHMHDRQQRRYLPEAKKIWQELRLLLARLDREDTLIVALSGHGVQFKGKDKGQAASPSPYFCPVDARLSDRTTLIALDDLFQQLKVCKASRKMLLVDACRNDPLGKGSKSLPEVDLETLRGLQKMPLPKGIVAFFSCSAGEKSFEEARLKHGVFFYHVLQGWNGAAANKDGEVTLDGLAAYTKKETKKYVHLKLGAVQRPYLRSDLEDDWVLRKLDGRPEFAEGCKAAQRNEYDRAIAHFDRALRFNPRFADAYRMRGIARREKGLNNLAMADLNEAIRLNPRDSFAYSNRAWTYNHKQEHDRAIADCTTALGIDPKNKWAYLSRGAAYHSKGDAARAIREYNAALRIDPEFQWALHNRGVAFSDKGKHDRAIADLTATIRVKSREWLNPNKAWSYFSRGLAHKSKNNAGRALSDLNAALRLDAKYAAAYHWRGVTHHERGHYTKAIADQTEAIRLIPQYASAYYWRGVSYHNSRQYDRAIADQTEAIRQDPKNAYAYYWRGTSYQELKQYDQVIADQTEALRLDPKMASAYYYRGVAYHWKGQHSRAIAEYTQAIRLDPKYADAYNNRGSSYGFKKKWSRALADFTRAIRLNPNVAFYYENRSKAYESLGKRAQAKADLLTSRRLTQKN